MTWDHWPEAWETADLSKYRAGFLSGREACQWIVNTLNALESAAIFGLFDGDVAWWCYDALARQSKVDCRWLDALAMTSGLHPEERDELWALFDDACRKAPACPCQFGWDIAEGFAHAALVAQGVGIERDGFRYAGSLTQKVDCNAVYRLLDEGLCWSLLEGKRLAIVSSRADEVAARLTDKFVVRANGVQAFRWSVKARVFCPNTSVPKRDHWPRMRDELFAAEWDLLLCSAGSLSSLLCDHTRSDSAAWQA